jgi:hypothetical protein
MIERVEGRSRVIQKRFWWSNLLHPSMIQDNCSIELKQRAQAVSNHDHGSTGKSVPNNVLNGSIRDRVNTGFALE